MGGGEARQLGNNVRSEGSQTPGRAGGRPDRPGRHPARRPAAGRPAAFHPASDAGRWVCGGVPADRRGRGEAAGRAGAVGEAAGPCRRDRQRDAGGGARPDLGQRMHDALEDVCDRLLRSDTALPDAGGTPATVILTLDLADLADKTGYAVASDGTLIPTEKAMQLANAAEVYFAAVSAKGEVLQLGRSRRIATRSQTIALIARDQGCSFSGCDTAPEWTERHHVIPWSEGGNDGPGQPDPALSLPPPQLPQHRLGLHHQPRRATRLATTLVGRPRTQTLDQQPHPQRHGCCQQPPTAVDRSSGGKWPGWPGTRLGISPPPRGFGEAQRAGSWSVTGPRRPSALLFA